MTHSETSSLRAAVLVRLGSVRLLPLSGSALRLHRSCISSVCSCLFVCLFVPPLLLLFLSRWMDGCTQPGSARCDPVQHGTSSSSSSSSSACSVQRGAASAPQRCSRRRGALPPGRSQEVEVEEVEVEEVEEVGGTGAERSRCTGGCC